MLKSERKTTIEGVRGSKALQRTLATCILAVAAVCLASCVASESPLIVGSKPILGQQFNMVLYREYLPGKGYNAQEVQYRWSDGGYMRNSDTTKLLVKLAAETLGGDDLLVQRSRVDRADGNSSLYDYWIARKITDGTYLFFSLNEHDLTPEDRRKNCAKEPEGFCVVNNHDALIAFARATASKPVRDPAVGILVDNGVREGKSNGLDRGAQ